MNALQQLIARQKAQQAGESNVTVAKQSATGNDGAQGSVSESNNAVDSEQPAFVSSPSEAPAQPAGATPAAAGGLRLNVAGLSKPKSGVPAGTGSSRPASAGMSGLKLASAGLASGKASGSSAVESAATGSSDFSLADLAGATDEGDAPVGSTHFGDEIDATAPTRELPADLEPQQKQFIESLDGIYTVLDDAEMFGSIVRNIMVELQEQPQYIKLIADKDVHTMIRGMRNTMGLARIKKQEKSRKTSGTKARKGSTRDNDVASDLDALLAMSGEG